MDDWSVLAASKDDLVTTLRQKKYVDLLPAYDGVSYIEGKARFADGALIVGDAPMKVGKVILAMGAHAAVPPIPGMDSVPYLTRPSELALDRLPKSRRVIGGAVMGVRQGKMVSRLV